MPRGRPNRVLCAQRGFDKRAESTGRSERRTRGPADRSRYGFISEHHAFGQSEKVAGDYAEDLAASMLATALGIPFDPGEAWDERREEWQMSGRVVTTQNHTIVAEATESGEWITVVSAAVFCA